MAEATWEKPVGISVPARTGRWKFLVGGALILAAIGYLILSGTLAGARYFITVEELATNPAYIGQTVRISGAVLGDSIQFDQENLIMEFTISNIPQEFENLALALHEAVNNPNAARLSVRVEGQPKPDLLQHEAQAILTGRLDENGVFHASELLLKCPSRFEEAGPDQSIGQEVAQPEV
ncbi:MAG: cytochrome c maturation protein CcmE [Anaerolineae bacterium]|nr:cytochrome c maturation protein CcmE [Anaerolineae bacterium]